MATLLYRVGRWCATHYWRVIGGWLAVLLVFGALAGAFGKPATSVVDIPNSEFVQVMDDLAERLPDASGNVSAAVFTTDDGQAFTPEQRTAIGGVIDDWSEADHVVGVLGPFAAQQRLDDADAQLADGREQLEAGEAELDAGAEQLEAGKAQLAQAEAALDAAEQMAPDSPQTAALRQQVDGARAQVAQGEEELAQGRAELDQARSDLERGEQIRDAASGVRFVSESGAAAIAQLSFDLDPQSMTPEEREAIVEVADPLAGVGVSADFGSEITQELSVVGIAEVIGLAMAGVVLLLMLGSLLAAGLPLLMALVGVGVGLAAAVAASYLGAFHTMTPALALMLGLAVGIDYMLFIVNRHRQHYLGGMELVTSIGRANGTAGSAVVFAGSTVIVALAGLLLSGIPLLAQMGLVAAGTVFAAVCVSVTLGPALLGLLGRRVASRRTWEKAGRQHVAATPVADRYVGLVTRRPWLTVAAVLAAVGVMSVPTLDLRLGLPDGSAEPPGSSAARAYATVADEFGPGMNGPLLVVADLPATTGAAAEDAASDEAAELSAELTAELLGFDGVVSVVPVGESEDHRTLAWQVVLDSGPTEAATDETVKAILAAVPDLEDAHGAEIGLTGRTIANIEISDRMAGVLPGYLAVVVGLSMVILVLVFRSLVVPLIATGGFLLSVSAAFGALVAVHQWGWLGGIFGVHTPGPLMSFGPILLIGVLFGLAMDYQMFLVSGMREAHAHGQEARFAVRTGFNHGARVVIAAAIIMFSVFGGFVFSHMVMVRPIGFGLAIGVLVDAVLIRMTLTPALMHLLDEHAWWIPRWLDRLLPDLDVEGTKLADRLDADTAAATDPDADPEPALARV